MPRFVSRRDLQEGAFARISEGLSRETPLYAELKQTNEEVNVRIAAERSDLGLTPEDARALSRVMHCATRLGTPQEAAQMTRVYAAMDMHPVNFYDLTEGGENAQPFISTAYRSTRGVRHRMFSSLLRPDYFAPPLRAKLEEALSDRALIPAELTALADEAVKEDGLPEAKAARFVDLFSELTSFKGIARDHALYAELKALKLINAADIVCFHKDLKANHATPCSLDIDRLFKEMRRRFADELSDMDHRGMKESIEGPPPPASPEDALVFLRQTSYNALSEQVRFENRDGSVVLDRHVARFGEIEQRGVALTPTGKALYDQAVLRTGTIMREIDGTPCHGKALARKHYDLYTQAYRECFDALPKTHLQLRARGLAYYAPEPTGKAPSPEERESAARLWQFTERGETLHHRALDAFEASGLVRFRPVTYDDFLPVSAAGIFGSNDPLKKTESEIESVRAVPKPAYTKALLEGILEAPIAEYTALCERDVREAESSVLRALAA